MACCREVAVLRSFSDFLSRTAACDRLVRRYVVGRRSARDVVDGLKALYAQQRHAECVTLLRMAFDALQPVPTLLWLWACEHLGVLDLDTIRTMLRMCAVCTRYDKHLRCKSRELYARPEGLVALLHECHRLPGWATDAVRNGLKHYNSLDEPACTTTACTTCTTSCTPA